MVAIKFYIDPVENEERSADTGKIEFDDVEMIHIIVDSRSEIQRPVTDQDRVNPEFKPYYDAWKEGAAPPTIGTPLAEWPQASRGQVEALNRIQIKSVEDFATSPDTSLGRLGPGFLPLREKARAWLETAKDRGATAEELHSLRTENAELKEKLNGQSDQIEELFSRLAQVDDNAAAAKAEGQKAKRGGKAKLPPGISEESAA